MSRVHRHLRRITIINAVLGAVCNSIVAAQIISFHRMFRWEIAESEWEESYSGGINMGVSILALVLYTYFATSTVACLMGFCGALQSKPKWAKLYRDYCVGDLSVSTLVFLLLALTSFRPAVRTGLCEELARQPDLMRSLSTAGLDNENCEPWCERAVFGIAGFMAAILIIRLQCTMVASSFCSQLHRLKSPRHLAHLLSDSDGATASRQMHLSPEPSYCRRASGGSGVAVYAVVSLTSFTPQATEELDATDACFSESDSLEYQRQHHNKATVSDANPFTQHHRQQFSNAPIHPPSTPAEELLTYVYRGLNGSRLEAEMKIHGYL